MQVLKKLAKFLNAQITSELHLKNYVTLLHKFNGNSILTATLWSNLTYKMLQFKLIQLV